MKFSYLKSKIRSCELLALILMGGTTPNIIRCASVEAVENCSVIITCKAKFDAYFDQFVAIFEKSFDIDSTEMFDVTGAKLLQAQKSLEELIHWLQEEARTIATVQGKDSIDYQYIHELILVADEHFKRHFVPLVTTFNKHYRENLTKFIGTLKKSIEPLVTEATFNSLKKHIDKLKDLCVAAGQTAIADKYSEIWQIANEARQKYLTSNDPAVLSKWRKRTPRRTSK